MARSLGQMVSDTWTDVWETVPCSQFDLPAPGSLASFLGMRTYNYRERLDGTRFNYRGIAISRMTIVRNNLARLGPTRLNPARLR